ncbi:MAG: acyltransferase [Clostridia bacterium]|nr:acyltransferase [Clostridia bacterium]
MNKFKRKFIQFKTDVERFIQYGDLPTSMYVKNGLKVGERFSRQSGTRLDISNCWLIEIKNNVTLANRVQILAHDDAAEQLCGYRKVGKVVIGNNVFVGAGTTVLPGVTIGDNSIIGAGSLVNKSIPPNSVAAGVPVRVIKTVDEYISGIKDDIKKAENEGRILDITYDINCNADNKALYEDLKEGENYYFKITRFCDQTDD